MAGEGETHAPDPDKGPSAGLRAKLAARREIRTPIGAGDDLAATFPADGSPGRGGHADSPLDDGPMPGPHTRAVPGGRAAYLTERLWEMVSGLPVESVPIDLIQEFDEDCWFGGSPVTCRRVARHADLIQKADLTYPAILSVDGRLMDGGHRIAKAWLSGRTTIDAVRFSVDPKPDYIEWDSSA